MRYRYSIQKHNDYWCVIEQRSTEDAKFYAIIWKYRLKSKLKKFAKDLAEQPDVYFIDGVFDIPSNYQFK